MIERFLPALLLAIVGGARAARAAAADYDPAQYARRARENPGDARRGEQLIRDDKRTTCLRCHKVGGSGAEFGPDLSNVGGKLGREHLVQSILEPSRQIVEGFRGITLVTTQGQVLSGFAAVEAAGQLRIVDAQGQTISLPIAAVAECRKTSTASPMPDNLAATLSPDEFCDLVAYLETLGAAGQSSPGGGVQRRMSLPAGFARNAGQRIDRGHGAGDHAGRPSRWSASKPAPCAWWIWRRTGPAPRRAVHQAAGRRPLGTRADRRRRRSELQGQRLYLRGLRGPRSLSASLHQPAHAGRPAGQHGSLRAASGALRGGRSEPAGRPDAGWPSRRRDPLWPRRQTLCRPRRANRRSPGPGARLAAGQDLAARRRRHDPERQSVCRSDLGQIPRESGPGVAATRSRSPSIRPAARC